MNGREEALLVRLGIVQDPFPMGMDKWFVRNIDSPYVNYARWRLDRHLPDNTRLAGETWTLELKVTFAHSPYPDPLLDAPCDGTGGGTKTMTYRKPPVIVSEEMAKDVPQEYWEEMAKEIGKKWKANHK